MPWSETQKDFFANSHHSFNVLCGAVSSGKTYISNIRWFDYVMNEAPKYSLLIMAGKTMEALYDNCIRDLKTMDDGIGDWQFSHVRPGAVSRIIIHSKNIEIACIGGDNETSWTRVQGKTVAGAYFDEATNLPRSLIKLVSKGCRHLGKQWPKFFTTNPDVPSHFIRTEYLLNEKIDIGIWNFLMTDNPSLTKEYKEELENTYTGVLYDRFILGKWVASSEFTVYRFDRRVNGVKDKIEFIPGAESYMALDFGISDPTFIIVCQVFQVPKRINKHGIIIQVVDEYVNRNKDAAHYKNWILSRPYYNQTDWRFYGDPAGAARGASLKSWISELAPEIPVQYRTKPSVNDMISCANKFISCVRINERQCPRTFEMFENWAYPTDKNDQPKEGALPNHDLYSHPGTAWYYGTINHFGGDLAGRGGATNL